MFEDPAFYQRWRTAWNDLMLTDRYLTNDGCTQPALNLIRATTSQPRGLRRRGVDVGLDCRGRDRDNAMCGDVRSSSSAPTTRWRRSRSTSSTTSSATTARSRRS